MISDEDLQLGSNLDDDDDDGPGEMALKPPARTSTSARSRTTRATRAATARILLEESDEIPPTGLFVGLNGKAYIIKPGEEVDVPIGVLEVLENAVIRVPVVDPQTRQVVDYRDRTRLPFRVLRRG